MTSNKSIIYKMDYKDIENLIEQYLPVRTIEKQENGEVFTPMHLIEEMFDKLPKEVWKNPNLKWLDPANGIGNFPMVAFHKLNEGLKDVDGFKDETKRKEHIIANMLYMVELNPKNIKISRQIFGKDANIFCGSFLEDKWKKSFGIEKFDIIMGNPPFNKGGIKSKTGEHLGESNETIWPDFVINTFPILKDGGYLCYIHPLSWLKITHSCHDIILEKHIIWIKVWDSMKSINIIKGEIPISIYVLHNKKNINKRTQFISEFLSNKLEISDNVVLDKNHSVPLAFHSIFNKLLRFIAQNNLQLEFHTKTIKSKGDKIRLPNEYKLEDRWAVDTYTIKEGIFVKKALESHPDADKDKIIIANKSSFKGSFIDNGRLGLTGSDKFYIKGDNLKLILKLLSFRITYIIGQYNRYRQKFLDSEAFKYIPDIRKLGITDITEDEFYKLLKLSEEEIEQIYNITNNTSYNEDKSQEDSPRKDKKHSKKGGHRFKLSRKTRKSKRYSRFKF